jgi:hypothetical protein
MSADAAPSPVALVAKPYALRLLQAFCALESMDLRRSLAEFAEHVAAGALPRAPIGLEGETELNDSDITS